MPAQLLEKVLLCLKCRFCPSSNRMNDFFLHSRRITPPNHHYLCVQRYSKRVKTVTFSLLSCLPPTMGKFNFPSNYTIDEVAACLSYFFIHAIIPMASVCADETPHRSSALLPCRMPTTNNYITTTKTHPRQHDYRLSTGAFGSTPFR